MLGPPIAWNSLTETRLQTSHEICTGANHARSDPNNGRCGIVTNSVMALAPTTPHPRFAPAFDTPCTFSSVLNHPKPPDDHVYVLIGAALKRMSSTVAGRRYPPYFQARKSHAGKWRTHCPYPCFATHMRPDKSNRFSQ
jgi:hypothetical protein